MDNKDRLLNVPDIVKHAQIAIEFKTDTELVGYLGIITFHTLQLERT